MNPLTNVKNIQKLSEQELKRNFKTSWHDQYKDSAWVFIGGLPYDLTEGDVICVFSQYGEVVNLNLVRDKATGKSKGFCFLCYEDQRSTVLAVDNFNGMKILGRVIRVDHVNDYKPPKESKNIDEVTKTLYETGCAPGSSVLSMASAKNKQEDNENKDIITKIKKEKKKKSRKEKQKKSSKKKSRKKKKKRKKEESSSSSSSSSSSTSKSSDISSSDDSEEEESMGKDTNRVSESKKSQDKNASEETVRVKVEEEEEENRQRRREERMRVSRWDEDGERERIHGEIYHNEVDGEEYGQERNRKETLRNETSSDDVHVRKGPKDEHGSGKRQRENFSKRKMEERNEAYRDEYDKERNWKENYRNEGYERERIRKENERGEATSKVTQVRRGSDDERGSGKRQREDFVERHEAGPNKKRDDWWDEERKKRLESKTLSSKEERKRENGLNSVTERKYGKEDRSKVDRNYERRREDGRSNERDRKDNYERDLYGGSSRKGDYHDQFESGGVKGKKDEGSRHEKRSVSPLERDNGKSKRSR